MFPSHPFLKRVIPLVLILALCLGIFVGCGEDTEEETLAVPGKRGSSSIRVASVHRGQDKTPKQTEGDDPAKTTPDESSYRRPHRWVSRPYKTEGAEPSTTAPAKKPLKPTTTAASKKPSKKTTTTTKPANKSSKKPAQNPPPSAVNETEFLAHVGVMLQMTDATFSNMDTFFKDYMTTDVSSETDEDGNTYQWGYVYADGFRFQYYLGVSSDPDFPGVWATIYFIPEMNGPGAEDIFNHFFPALNAAYPMEDYSTDDTVSYYAGDELGGNFVSVQYDKAPGEFFTFSFYQRYE